MSVTSYTISTNLRHRNGCTYHCLKNKYSLYLNIIHNTKLFQYLSEIADSGGIPKKISPIQNQEINFCQDYGGVYSTHITYQGSVHTASTVLTRLLGRQKKLLFQGSHELVPQTQVRGTKNYYPPLYL